MSQNNQATVEKTSELLPAPVISYPDSSPALGESTHTFIRPFQSIKHLLSGKPSRRPNRIRPLDDKSDPSDLTTAETYPMQERAALAAGWDDPDLDSYEIRDTPR